MNLIKNNQSAYRLMDAFYWTVNNVVSEAVSDAVDAAVDNAVYWPTRWAVSDAVRGLR